MNFSDYLYYDETSPSCLRWKVQRGKYKQGDVAGGIIRKRISGGCVSEVPSTMRIGQYGHSTTQDRRYLNLLTTKTVTG